jgi:hypothetical protein
VGDPPLMYIPPPGDLDELSTIVQFVNHVGPPATSTPPPCAFFDLLPAKMQFVKLLW